MFELVIHYLPPPPPRVVLLQRPSNDGSRREGTSKNARPRHLHAERIPGERTSWLCQVSYLTASSSLPHPSPRLLRIGTSLRQSMNGDKNSPGPGNYNINGGERGPKWGFGSGLRNFNKGSEDPGKRGNQHKLNHPHISSLKGPGTYNIPPFFADVPKFMMSNNPRYNYP